MLLGYVHVRSHKLDHIARRVLYRVGEHVKVPDGSILSNDSVVVLIVAGVADSLLNLFRKRRSIFGMHSAQYRLQGHLRRRVQTENTEALLAHVNVPGRNAAGPASRVAEALPL